MFLSIKSGHVARRWLQLAGCPVSPVVGAGLWSWSQCWRCHGCCRLLATNEASKDAAKSREMLHCALQITATQLEQQWGAKWLERDRWLAILQQQQQHKQQHWHFLRSRTHMLLAARSAFWRVENALAIGCSKSKSVCARHWIQLAAATVKPRLCSLSCSCCWPWRVAATGSTSSRTTTICGSNSNSN